jgi:N-acetylneuraminic acid mutarotase
MKYSLPGLAIVLLLFPLFMNAQGTWTKKPSIGNSDWVERYGAGAFNIGSDGYVVGGSTVGRQSFRSSVQDVYRYSGNTWSHIADCATFGRVNGVAFTVNGKGYVGTGYIQANNNTPVLLNDLWEYNPATGAWTQKASISSGRYGSFCFVIGNYGYIGCGYSTNYRSDCARYNAVTNTWSSIASLPAPEARYGAAGFSIGTKGFMSCGSKSANPSEQKDLWQYDTLTNVWIAKASLPVAANACIWPAGFAINGKGYVAGGVSSTVNIYNACFEYDTTGNSWIQKASMPLNTSMCAEWVSGNEAFLVSGLNAGANPGTAFIKFNPATNTWTTLTAPVAAARSRMCAAVINGKLFIGAGVYGDYNYFNVTTGSSVFRRDTWLYNPATETWSAGDSLPVARANASSFTIDSNIYIAGGVDGSNNPQTDCWSYNPANGVWTQRANFTGPARMAGVGLTIANRGYYGFGVANTSNYMNDWYEYAAASNTWIQRATPSAFFAGRFQAGAFAIKDKGYVVAGSTLNSNPAQCYEYNPANDSWTFKANLNADTRNAGAAFAIGNKGYYACGYLQTGYLMEAAFTRDLYEFDPVANTWTQKASLPVAHPREGCVGAGINGYGYVCGGMEVSTSPNGSDEFFTYKSDLWQFTPDSIVPSIVGGATAFCAGNAITVDFRTVALTLNAGNIYTLQLSDASGSFASPVALGTSASTATTGTITGTVPSAQTAGTGYRIRIVSSNVADIGDDNGVNLAISRNALSISSFTPGNGLAGDSVTVNGQNFIGATAVRFNGVPAAFRVVSATQLKAAVPLLCTTGKINVVTACNSVLSSGNFTVNNFNFTVSVFVEGLYIASGQMNPSLYLQGLSSDTAATDTLFMKLHNNVSPHAEVYFTSSVLRNGQCTYLLPGGFYNSSYYVELWTRNTLATWSKFPQLINTVHPFDLRH